MLTRLLWLCSMVAGLLLASYHAAHGQTTVPITFGKLNGNEFDDKNFVADSGAEAVVLVDYGRTIFDFAPGMYDTYHQLVFQRTTRIKILKKAGYHWATVEIPLFHRGASNERVSNLQATTYNMVNGQLVSETLPLTAVFTEEKDENRTLRKFTFPNVKEGSVIEYTYTIKSDFLFNLQDWQFQYSIPVHWSEYRALIPEYYNYKMLLQGYEPLEIQLQEEAVTQAGLSYTQPHSYSDKPIKKIPNGRATKYQWAMKNVPAFRAEPFITSAQDYVARIDFELEGMELPGLGHENLTETWEKLNTDLLSSDHFGGQLSNAGFLKVQVAAITAQHTDLKERAIAIHELTKKSITHNGANGISSAKGLRKAYELHKGSAADVNLLFIALLRAAGLTADPVILSTRDFGRINPDFPMISRFNYVLAALILPGQTQPILLDATQTYAGFGILPERCLNTQGHLVTQNPLENHWVIVNSPQRYLHFQTAQLTLDDRGGLTGKIHDEQGGYQGTAARRSLQELGEKKYIETNYLKIYEGWSIPKYSIQQADILAKPLALDMEVNAPGENKGASVLYFTPMRYLGKGENPFRSEKRLYPIDFGVGRDETQMLTVTIPAGYEVEEMPKSAHVMLPNDGGRFQYLITPTPTGLQIVSRVNIGKPAYSAEEYADLREFYNLIIAKHAEQIVLKKKS